MHPIVPAIKNMELTDDYKNEISPRSEIDRQTDSRKPGTHVEFIEGPPGRQ